MPDALATLLPLAEALARRFLRRLPRRADPDEVRAAALEGAWRATLRWRPDGGASLRTFAGHLIRASIMDRLRANLPRGARRARVRRLPAHHSLDHEDALELAAPEQPPALDDADEADALLRHCTEWQRLALRMTYLGGMTRAEAGAVLGLTKAGAGHLCQAGLAMIRESLGVAHDRG